MILLSIGFTSKKYDIYDKLNELSTYFKEKGINIGLVECDCEEMHFLKYIIKDEENLNYNIQDIRKSFNVYAANMIYQIIADNYDEDTIAKIVRSNYYYFKNDEINEITKKCKSILTGTDITSNEYYLLYINRKNSVINRILDYINEYTDIVLEGFLTFRLKDFNRELDNIVDRVVEEYLIEREYNEFIKLLRYFVEIQESRVEVVNVVPGLDGNYYMYDNDYNKITDDLVKELIDENIDGEKNYDDMLVSSLITIAPQYIIIHNVSNIRNKELIETIKNVFSDRVRMCPGCDFCVKSSRPIHKV